MKKIRKGLPLAALLSLCCVSSAFAANTNMMKHPEKGGNECSKIPPCPPCEPCETNRCIPTGCGSFTAPAKPCLCCEGNWFVTGEFLWWTANEDGLAFATKGIGPFGAASASSGKIFDLNHHQHWDPGFRVGLGYTFEHDGWDLYLNYTWFRNSRDHDHDDDDEEEEEVAVGNTTLFDVLGNPGGFNNVSEAKARWKHLLYQTLDLEFGRWSWLGKYLAFRPHVGARGGFIHQKFKVHYVDTTGGITGDVTNRHNVDGVGPRAGFNTSWYFCGDWSIFGDAAFAVLWTSYRVKQKQTFNPPTGNTPVNVHERINSVKTVLDLGLGLRWEYYGCNNRWHMALELGWEHHNWINHNQMVFFVDDIHQGAFVQNHGDLGLYGANFKVRFDF